MPRKRVKKKGKASERLKRLRDAVRSLLAGFSGGGKTEEELKKIKFEKEKTEAQIK